MLIENTENPVFALEFYQSNTKIHLTILPENILEAIGDGFYPSYKFYLCQFDSGIDRYLVYADDLQTGIEILINGHNFDSFVVDEDEDEDSVFWSESMQHMLKFPVFSIKEIPPSDIVFSLTAESDFKDIKICTE